MEKYAVAELSTRMKITCDTESINMWISADEAYRFTDFRILRHHDIITILYWKYEFRFKSEYQT